MLKTLKFIIIGLLIITLSLYISVSYATSPTSLDEEESSQETTETQDSNTVTTQETPEDSSSLSNLRTSPVTSISSINSYESANLQLNNILCIILIAIGTLLILFAIAILVRLHSLK